jgi:hypothetical protein
VTFEIWAPEEDTSSYYGHFHPMAFSVMDDVTGVATAVESRLIPPPGVDAGAFYNLVQMRASGAVDNLLAIDKAKNNTSVVFLLKWQGWRLLFTGDAEHRSWKTMKKHGVLSPVDFIKVSHHGSHTGTPNDEILDEILPQPGPSDWERFAMVSTRHGAYTGVPSDEVTDEIESRCTLCTTEGLADGEPFDIEFYA